MRPVLGTYGRHRYAVLFFTLMISLVMSPLANVLGIGGGAVEFFIAMNLVAAMLALVSGPLRVPAATVLALVLAVRILAEIFDQRDVVTASLLTWGVLALLAAAGALTHALLGKGSGSEPIFAALSAYLLAGFCFGLLYWALEQFSSGSLAINGTLAQGPITVPTAIYYSFVTLASLGYGDITPVSDLARGLAVIEVIGGQLYLAALVARLVGPLE